MTETTTKPARSPKPPEAVERLRVFSCNDTLWNRFIVLVGERERSGTLRQLIAEFVERER